MRAEVALPHSVEAEQATLGGLLLEPTAWSRVASLTASDFYRPDHRLIFAAIADLCASGAAVDVVLIEDCLKRRQQLSDVGGFAYLVTLARETPTAANIESYAAKVRQYSLQRRLLAFGEQVVREAAQPGESAEAILTRAQERLLDLQASSRTGKGLVSSQQLMGEFLDDLDRRASGEDQKGLQIGLTDFDVLIHGLEPGDLAVIAGRPGMGKSALLVTIAAHVAQRHGVAVFSAEMPARQLMRRCVALLGSIPQGRLRAPEQLSDADWSAIMPAAGQIQERRLWIDDTARPRIAHIRAECLALKAKQGLGLVLVDYLQLVRGAGNNRYEELHDVAYGLKALAKDLCVPVIALAQLNRGVESRDEKRPHASDLRDSGAIEEAADIIGLLYSEGYYDPAFSMPYVLECQIEKNRNGERGQCLWEFAGAYSRVATMDPGGQAQYRRMIAQGRSRGTFDG